MPGTPNLTRLDRMACVAGGIALVAWALGRSGLARSGSLGLAGWLLYQAYTAENPLFRPLGIRVNSAPRDAGGPETIVIDEAVTVSDSRDTLYRFWRDLPALTIVAPRLRSVEVLDPVRSRWQVRGPAGVPVEWDAEITRDRPGEEIAWQTTRHGAPHHFGWVRFDDAPGDRGTFVRVHLEYAPPAGVLGTALARIMGQSPQRLVREALRRSKQLLETGEIATTAGQPAGAGRSPLARRLERMHEGRA